LGKLISRRKAFAGAGLAIGGWVAWDGYTLAKDPAIEKDCGPDGTTPPTPPNTDNSIQWSKRGGSVNDASCLSRTPIFGLVSPTSEQEIAGALAYARTNKLKLSMAGARHSMGGHAFAANGVVLDMTRFNTITINPDVPSVTVQAGAKWHDIQLKLHPKFAVKAMQSTDVFTVGGSISVNAHGMDHHVGAIERTIRWMRVMMADGTIVRASRTENVELYRHVVGGYGLFGVILNVELDISENTIYQSERELISFADFGNYWKDKLENNDKIGLFYGHLSTSPGSFLTEMLSYTYHKADLKNVSLPALSDIGSVPARRLIFNLAKQGNLFERLKWYSEKELENRFESCTISEIIKAQECFVSRNEPMHDSVPYLFNALDYETDILHEYFVPRENLAAFVPEMGALIQAQDVLLLNASIRVVHKEDFALNYAPADAFSVVLYINQRTDAAGIAKMKRITSDLIDLADRHGGRFFLPYQRHYTAAQLHKAYPMIADVFQAKKKFDPAELFSNSFYAAYTI
jgi:FAD/FMN-containing dehydrogenase